VTSCQIEREEESSFDRMSETERPILSEPEAALKIVAAIRHFILKK
jgi:hypothetical protein